MQNIKNFTLSFIFSFTLIISFLIIINCLFYFNLVNESIYKFFKVLIMMSSVFTSSLFLGRRCTNKGYFNGFLFGLIIVSFMFILSIIFGKLQIKLFFYYLIIISSSTLGGTIGIRKKKH